MTEPAASRRRVFNDVRRNLEAQRVALAVLVRRLEPSVEAGEWRLRPDELREDLARARDALRL